MVIISANNPLCVEAAPCPHQSLTCIVYKVGTYLPTYVPSGRGGSASSHLFSITQAS